MEYNTGSHAYLSRSAQKHCVSLGSSENQTARQLWMCKTFVWERNCERKVKEPGGPADSCTSLVSGEGEEKEAEETVKLKKAQRAILSGFKQKPLPREKLFLRGQEVVSLPFSTMAGA